MLAPYQVAHSNYKLVEGVIDAHLQANDFRKGGCLIQAHPNWKPEVLENLLRQYKTAGWCVEILEFPLSKEPVDKAYGELPVSKRYSADLAGLRTYQGMYFGFLMPESLIPETNPLVRGS